MLRRKGRCNSSLAGNQKNFSYFMQIKKAINKIHLWLGLTSGLVVFLLGLTGCILAFEPQIKDIVYKKRYTVEHSNEPLLPLTQLLPAAQKALGGNRPVNGIDVPVQPGKTVSFTAFKEDPNGWNDFNTVEYYNTVYVNPYTAEVVKVENTNTEFFRVVLMLHYDLFLDVAGKKIIGWATVVFVVMLVSGLILWWPKNKAAAKQRFTFRWKKTTRWKRKNYDLHNILGFYALVFSLIIALTGLVWAFPAFDNGMQWLMNGGKTIAEKEYFSDTVQLKQQAAVYDKVLKDMQQRSPADHYYIGIPEQKSETIYGYSEFMKDAYRWTSYYYDQYSGENIKTAYYDEKPAGEKLRNMNYYLHTGLILSWPGQVLAFIISFICMTLPLTGFYIWWGRRKKVPVNIKAKAALSPALVQQ